MTQPPGPSCCLYSHALLLQVRDSLIGKCSDPNMVVSGCVCVCVCVYVCVRARACVCVCVCVMSGGSCGFALLCHVTCTACRGACSKASRMTRFQDGKVDARHTSHVTRHTSRVTHHQLPALTIHLTPTQASNASAQQTWRVSQWPCSSHPHAPLPAHQGGVSQGLPQEV